jgi:DNA end-binding protein Ku
VVLIRPEEGGLVLHTLYYVDELHQANKTDMAKGKFSAKELELAKTLISRLSAPFRPPAFHDTYRENVQRLIEQKKKGQKVTAIAQPRKAPVVDLMEALKRSLKSSESGPSKSVRSSASSKKAAGRRRAA